MHTNTFSIKSNESFGASGTTNTLTYYHHNQDSVSLQINGVSSRSFKLAMHSWDEKGISWTMTSSDKYGFTMKGLHPDSDCLLLVNDVPQHIRTTKDGILKIMKTCKSPTRFLIRYEN